MSEFQVRKEQADAERRFYSIQNCDHSRIIAERDQLLQTLAQERGRFGKIETEMAVELNKLHARVERLEKALAAIIEIGKRDMSNPKYDGYFDIAKEALKADAEAGNPSSETWSAGSGKEPPPPR